MAKYYWSKYNTKKKYQTGPLISNPSDTLFLRYGDSVWSGYVVNENTGVISMVGTQTVLTASVRPPVPSYFMNEMALTRVMSVGTPSDNHHINVQFGIYNIIQVDAVGTLVQSNITAIEGTYPINGIHTDGYWYVRGALANTIPTITLNTPNNATLYENDTFKIDGSALDSDVGNIINVKYQINSESIRAITVSISTGASIPFTKQLTFKGGALYDDTTAVTASLNEGVGHTLKVWAEDDQGGKSAEQIRTFYVVPNRPPALTVDPFSEQSGMINNDTITFSGTAIDLDGNNVTVRYRLNEVAAVQIHSGVASPWSFDLSLRALKDGANKIVVEVTDTYNFKTSKTITLNKQANLTPLSQSTQRYQIVPPSGSAKGVLLWVQRDTSLTVSADISMTTGVEQEQYSPMTLDGTAPVSGNTVEDEFFFEAADAKENINVRLTLVGVGAITLISGVLS